MHQQKSVCASQVAATNSREQGMLAILHMRAIVFIAAIAAMPFLLTRIPPLTDVPGHIGQFSVQTAATGDGLLRYFGFHWRLTLNLASDLLVEALHPMLGVVPATWLLCAATPVLTVIGIMALARATNRNGAYALPWALLFVFNFPFLWGFLNFALTEALSIIAFAGWVALERKRRVRAAIFIVVTPMLLVGHGVAGIAAIVMIVGHCIGEHALRERRGWTAFAANVLASAWPPVLAGIVTLALWKTLGSPESGATLWFLNRKGGAIVHMLQDQNRLLDIGSVALSLIVWLVGWRWGARLSGGPASAVIAIVALFFVAPSMLSGSDELDTRLAPLVPMLAFALQDWSRVDARRRRFILLAGFALLAVRFAVTTVSFAGYGQRYERELAALDHIPHGARILNLTEVECDGWRSARLEHIGNLATTLRGAWVNSQWSIEGLHLLQVKFRPSPLYYNDPSQIVVPARCVDPAFKPYAGYRAAQTAVQAMPSLPLDQIDYLWLVNTKLPPHYRDDRLRRVWDDDISEVYAVSHDRRVTPATPESR